MSLEAKMLENITAALANHRAQCGVQPRAILLNPAAHEELDWDEIAGVPIEADETVGRWRFRIDCDGSAHGIENELEEFKKISAPELVPAGGPETVHACVT